MKFTPSAPGKMGTVMKYIGFGLPIVFMPFMARFPAVSCRVQVFVFLFPDFSFFFIAVPSQAVFMYWISNATMTTLTTFALNVPFTRKLVGLPPTPPPRVTPNLTQGAAAGPSGIHVAPPPAEPPKSSPNFARFQKKTPATGQGKKRAGKSRQSLKRTKRFYSTWSPNGFRSGVSGEHLPQFRGSGFRTPGSTLSTLL